MRALQSGLSLCLPVCPSICLTLSTLHFYTKQVFVLLDEDLDQALFEVLASNFGKTQNLLTSELLLTSYKRNHQQQKIWCFLQHGFTTSDGVSLGVFDLWTVGSLPWGSWVSLCGRRRWSAPPSRHSCPTGSRSADCRRPGEGDTRAKRH